MISRQQVNQSPGADQTNSLAMITNFTPGAYMVHDQLHIRGGHQVSWLLDGVPVPNTNIASNVGPQFDPKDIDYLEVQRGGYNAEYGDRTYGIFNVVTRSGFERNRQAELVANYGSFNNTNDQISFGDHTERFAYYGSLWGHRGWTHSFLFALAVGAVAAGLTFRYFRVSFWDLLGFYFVITASHGILDAFTNGGYGIPFFWPLHAQRYGPYGPIHVQDIGFEIPDPRTSRAIRTELLYVWLPTTVVAGLVAIYRRYSHSSLCSWRRGRYNQNEAQES